MADDREPEVDWIELLVRLAALLGMNPVRTRWKLERLRQRVGFEAKAARDKAAHIRYEHKHCVECGALCDRDDRECHRCGARLTSRNWQVLQRIGLTLPGTLSVSAALCLVLIVIYVRMIADVGGASPAGWATWSFDGELLVRYGGSWPPAIAGGQWWRLGTCIFLHAGIWHIGFNVFALWQIGPASEDLFGRARTLALFMVTGVAASSASYLFLDGVGIGASGAIMGLIGLAAGWGHRDGTTVGHEVRNRMVKWAVYVILFGFVIGADNVAHIAGFVAGGALGWVMPSKTQQPLPPAADMAAGLLGGGAALACAVLCLFPPASPVWAEEAALSSMWGDPEAEQALAEGLVTHNRTLAEACPHVRQGRMDDAKALLEARWEMGDEFWDQLGGEHRDAYLVALCDSYDRTVQTCERVAADGVDVLFTDGTVDDGIRADVEWQWQRICEGIGDP